MSITLRTLFFMLTIFISVRLKNVFCDQPKFISHEGDLVFQSAEDKNITICLSGSSRFLINDINVLESLQKFSKQNTPTEEVNIENLTNQVGVLKTDIQSFQNRMRRYENGTSSLPPGRVARLQTRALRLMTRITTILHNLATNNACESIPCKNGGTCYNLYNDFNCECPKTWTGTTCETDVDECKSFAGTDLGCQNKGVCINLPGSYGCNCTNGFIGAHCRDRVADCTKSLPGELCGKGQCIPANNALGYQCLCDAGWKIDNLTQSCTVDVNECVESLVSCHTTCINLPGSFACGPCPSGYTGDGVICRDINECERNNGGCSMLPKVQCINNEGSHRCGNCPPGWTGDGRYCSQAETYSCESTNICHPLARCEYISNVMVCVCPEGLTGSGYGRNGCRSGSANPCNEHNCQNGGTCVNHGGIATCICLPGFELPSCELKNPCLTNPCLNGGICTRRLNSNATSCNCPEGYYGNRCQYKRDSCSKVLNDTTGELTYPYGATEYGPNQACAWVIRTSPDLILNVTFSRFDLQLDSECKKDWLQINDGRSLATPVIGRFCGNQLPNGGNILSSHNILFLWFHTDNTINGMGFSLSWKSVPPICGGLFNVNEQGYGVITSPGYPGKSPPNRDCQWEIVAPLGKRVLLRFFQVVMESSENCTRDSLLIYDTNELLEQVCKTDIPSPKYSSTNSVKIHFQTDNIRQDSMFQMHYEVVDGSPGCGGLLTEPIGKIIFTLDLDHCVFLLQQPVGTRITIAFFNKYSDAGTASFKIYDGKTEDDPVLSVTNGDIPPGNFTSTGNSLLIDVQIKSVLLSKTTGVLFEADFKRVCGAELQEPLGGTFMTPNYPKPYYEDLDCVYSIVGPVNSVVHLNITDYDLSDYNQGCDDDADFIEIYFTLSGSPKRYCKGEQMHIVAPSNYLNLAFHSNTNPQRRRGISAEYHFEQIGCGGVLREAEGSFQRLSSTSPTSAYCEWILEAPDSNVISLDLTYLRTGTKCAPGEVDLKIFLNKTGTHDGRLVESHCGNEKRLVTILPSNLATIFLKLVPPSLGSAVAYGITANYTFTPRSSSNCGGNYSLLSGSIQSPGWPDEYPEPIDCIWVIHAPLGNKIELVPRNFSLEPSYRQCGDDYLEIKNGMSEESPLIGRYCGYDIPPHIPSFTNHLYLHFHSDSSLSYPGFDITFQQTSTGCGGSLTSNTGSITSPHYPELSPGPVQCDWKITISKGSSIDARITKIGPTANLCSGNVLAIYDGPDSLSKKLSINCSSDGDIILKSSKNIMFIRYVLPDDGAAENQQFYLEYETNCKRTLNSFEGVIESPNFPKEYPNNLKCEWIIEGRKADTISLTFSHFELEARDLQCAYDKFEVIDMKGEEVLQTHKICRDPTGLLTSDGNKFVIKFTTDSNHNANGFRLEYKRNGCGGHKNTPTFWFGSPNYPYSVDIDCEWFIEAPAGMQIVLDVSEVHIEGDGNCTTNGLIVKNDKTDIRNLLTACRVKTTTSTVTSQGSKMYVRFYSDSIRSRKYFKASYKRRQGQCGGVFRNTIGEITSPNYPENYPLNTYCEWMINIGNEPTYMELILETPEPTNATNCSNNLFEYYDGLESDASSQLIGQYCFQNVSRQRNVMVRNNIINVIFSSEDKPGKGFVLKYRKQSCGGVLRNEIGNFEAKVEDQSCLWLIKMKPGYKFTLSFSRIECHCDGLSSEGCATRGIRIYYLAKENIHICEEHPPDITIATTSDIIISARDITFTAKYNLIETACGGALSSLRGSLASPFYPESYPSNVECIWTINAPPGNHLEISFNEMNISSSENCNKDYLELRESSSTGQILGVFCSSAVPKDTLQGFESIWIKFRSSEDSIGKGFRLTWTNAQLNEINGINGKIRSPSIVSIKSEKEPFQWRITVPRDNVISLVFKEYNRGLTLYEGFDNTGLPVEIQMSPWQVTSSTSVVYLISDNQMLDEFIIEWKAISRDAIVKNETVQACNETLVIAYGTVITVTSPGYPTGYEPDLECQWLIKSDHPTRHAVMELFEVRLEKLDDCFADYLKVFSSNNLMNWHEELEICDSPPKKGKPFTVIHGTPYLKLELTTDSSINKTGFTANVYTACGSNLTNSIGRILDTDVISPSLNAKITQNCTWHIEVGAGRKIQFTFDFPKNTVQNSSDCENFALIRDGMNAGAPIIPPGRICSNNAINGTIITTTNRATVKYFLKPSSVFYAYEAPLWNLTYREYSECSGEVRLTSYSPFELINSPNYPNVPNPHTECVWIIIAPPGETVQVEFARNFDMNVRKCSNEYIEFRDGATEMARRLGKFCTKPPGTIRSSGNVLYVRYLTDIAEPRNGFKANVSLSTCGGTFTQYNNLITSANYPAPGGYPANSVCEYVIKVSSLSRVNLTFLDIDLPFDATNLNSSDQIRIYQILQGDSERVEDELTVIYGNTTSPSAVEIETNEVLIRFYSFKANSKFRGFKVKYDRIFGACYKDVSGESGVLTLNIAPQRMSMFLLCRWKITVPKGRRVKLEIIDVDEGPTVLDRSKTFRTTIYNDFQMLSRITMLDLNNITKAGSIRSSDNKMFLRIFGAYTTSLRKLRVEYSSSEESNCPDDIASDSGSLSVKDLGSTTNFFCSFDFKLSGNQTISFNVSRLVIEHLDQRLPSFAVRFRDQRYFETLLFLNSNTTNYVFAIAPNHGTVNILQNDAIRVRELDATYKKHPCGGQYSFGQRFEISMPNLTAEYGDLECAWQLLTPMNQNGLDLTANFSFTLPCEDEFVVVHSGPSIEHLEIAKLCRGETFNISRLNSREIYVYYHTKTYSPSSQMQIVLQKATHCGDKLNLQVSALEYLKFTSTDYKNNLECVWDVQAGEGFYLQIKFSGRFFIEESKDCTKDYLEIRKFENNDWISMPRYCGRNLPSAINTTAVRLQLTFRSDEANTGDGFTLAIRKTCYAVFNVTNQPQVIKYPQRWSMTRVRMTCDYILQTADPDKYIQVKFSKLNLGYRDRCQLTKLTAQKRSSDGYLVDMGPYCKDNAVRELRAKEYISLNYQAILETGGYEIEFSLDNCGGEIRKPTWISHLRNEAGDGYANDMQCVWNISAPADHNIVIQFKYLILEENGECSLDSVSIYKGSQIDMDNQEAKLCGNLTINPPSFHIDSNSAVLTAVSDSTVSREGFSARIIFSKRCNERITLTQANSPVDIDRNITAGSDDVMSCNIRAMGPPGFRIEIELKELNLNQQNKTCSSACDNCEYLEVIDSLQGGSETLGKYCRLGMAKTQLISSFKDILIRTYFERPGSHLFKVNLRLVPAECGSQSEYVLEDDGTLEIVPLQSPNGLYPPNTHCSWKITCRCDFELKFTQFSLQNKSDVTGQCLDYVLIRNTEIYKGNAISEHCGTIPSFFFKVERYGLDAVADITFHTDETIESTGFILTATKTSICNQTYSHTSGVMSGDLKSDITCLNEILLPENYSVNIYIASFYLRDSNCSENYIRIFDKKTNLKIYEDCKETYDARKIYTSTNQVRLDFKVSRSMDREVFYYSSPKSPLQGCGGNLDMRTGYLMSPNYQQYNNSSVCRWNLITTSPNRIDLFFYEFNMGSICKTDYLDIIEISNNGTERIARHYCEQEIIPVYTSESSRVSIVSVAALDFDGTGWLIFFRTRSESLRKKLYNN